MKKVLAEIQTLEQKIAAETGPRGGKIIGKTKSGKPIYDTANHSAHKDFSKEDHADAQAAHEKLADKAHKEVQKAKDAGHAYEPALDLVKHNEHATSHWKKTQS